MDMTLKTSVEARARVVLGLQDKYGLLRLRIPVRPGLGLGL
jgi:hypothetical protein